VSCHFIHTDNGLALSSNETVTDRQQEVQNTDVLISLSADGTRFTPIVVAQVVNPSSCRRMIVTVIEEHYYEVSIQPDGEVIILHEREFNDDGDVQQTRVGRHHVPAISNENVRFGARTDVTYFRNIGPGETLNIRANLRGVHASDAARTTATFATVTLNLLGTLI
jgi:hypothetical protein